MDFIQRKTLRSKISLLVPSFLLTLLLLQKAIWGLSQIKSLDCIEIIVRGNKSEEMVI